VEEALEKVKRELKQREAFEKSDQCNAILVFARRTSRA